MSYDIAVWEGAAPIGDRQALHRYIELSATYLEGPSVRANPVVANYLSILLEQWPDSKSDTSVRVWTSDGGGQASGPILLLNLDSSTADKVVTDIVILARSVGLIVFDPQSGKLLT